MPRYNAQVIPHSGVPNGHILENLFPKLKTVIGRHFTYVPLLSMDGTKIPSALVARRPPI